MEVTRTLRHPTNEGAIDLIRAIQSKEHEIRSIDDQIAKLVARRESCNTSLSILRSICSPLAPITRLPPELLARIFVLVAVKEFEGSIIPVLGFEPKAIIPWSLGLVCSQWRAVSRSEPLLWKHFECELSLMDIPSEAEGVFETMGASRSLQRLNALLPFGLTSLHIGKISSPTSIPWLDHPCLSNLTTLRLGMSFIAFTRFVLFPPNFPGLEELGLSITSTSELPTVDAPPLKESNIFRVARNVIRLSLDPWSSKYSDCLIGLPDTPWARLIQLDLSKFQFSHPQISQILSQCTALRELLFPTPPEELWPPEGPIHPNREFLPSLSSLSLTDGYYSSSNYIPFPWKQLKTLSIHREYTFFIKTFLSMTPRLESLSILEPYQDYQAEETDGTPVCLNSLRRMIIQSMGRHPNWFADDLITNHLVAPNLTMLHVKLPTPPSFPHLASPPNPILSFIRNSKMNLEILHFEPPIIRNRPQDESHLLRLLKLLHHLRVFIAPHVFFPRSLLNQMKQGHILPNVQQLEIRVASTRLFADMVERRVKESLEKEGFVRLKRACGFYPEFYRKSKVKDVRNERRKMDRLNEVYGTDLKLKAVGRRGDPFAIRDD